MSTLAQPAPGSARPGAPPALTRTLTDEDGSPTKVVATPVAATARGDMPEAAERHHPPDLSAYLPALGLVVAAATVAVDGWRLHRKTKTSADRSFASTQELS